MTIIWLICTYLFWNVPDFAHDYLTFSGPWLIWLICTYLLFIWINYLTLDYLWLFAIDYLWLFEFINYLWLFVSLIICNYLKLQLFEVICHYCFLSYLWLFERAIILISFIICCLVIWNYLKWWLIICCLDYLGLFDLMVKYCAALHGAKINSILMIRVTKTPSLKSGIEPETFGSQIAYVTTVLHWCSDNQICIWYISILHHLNDFKINCSFPLLECYRCTRLINSMILLLLSWRTVLLVLVGAVQFHVLRLKFIFFQCL